MRCRLSAGAHRLRRALTGIDSCCNDQPRGSHMRTKEFAKRALWAAALAGAVTVSVVVVVLGGCAGSGPYRNAALALLDPPTDCTEIYKTSDNDIREVASDFTLSDSQRTSRLQAIQNEISDSYNVKGNRNCWDTAHEHHLGYELFYTEFDDAGQAVDRVEGAAYEKSGGCPEFCVIGPYFPREGCHADQERDCRRAAEGR